MVFDEDRRLIFPTGFEGFDKALRGGAREGELIIIMAPLKRGKSLALTNIGAALFQMGHLVVHYTLEMYKEDCQRRYLACVTGLPTNSIEEYPNELKATAAAYGIFTDGDVIVKEFPGKLVTVDMIEGNHQMLTAKYGRAPVPIIDYADIIRGDSGEEWKDLPIIYHQLRNFGRRQRVPAFSASQTAWEGFKADKLGPQHQSGSKRKGFVVDVMFAMEQSDLDYAANRFRMIPILNRNERKDMVSYYLADYPCSRIEEVSEEVYMAQGISEGTSLRGKRDEGIRQRKSKPREGTI
jgi:hypothetical protein